MIVLSVVVSPGPGRVITVTHRIKDYAHMTNGRVLHCKLAPLTSSSSRGQLTRKYQVPGAESWDAGDIHLIFTNTAMSKLITSIILSLGERRSCFWIFFTRHQSASPETLSLHLLLFLRCSALNHHSISSMSSLLPDVKVWSPFCHVLGCQYSAELSGPGAEQCFGNIFLILSYPIVSAPTRYPMSNPHNHNTSREYYCC